MSQDANSSTAPSEPSSETSGRRVASRPYQRKVRLALNRREAVLVRKAMLRLAADPVARGMLGFEKHLTKTNMNLCRAVYRKTADAIERRDRGQRAKEHRALPPKPLILLGQTVEDVPLAELEGIV